jgi:Fic family protein
MNRWDTARHERRVAEISRELGRLFRFQTEFVAKDSSSVQERREYEASSKRIRELFAELKKLRIAA